MGGRLERGDRKRGWKLSNPGTGDGAVAGVVADALERA